MRTPERSLSTNGAKPPSKKKRVSATPRFNQLHRALIDVFLLVSSGILLLKIILDEIREI